MKTLCHKDLILLILREPTKQLSPEGYAGVLKTYSRKSKLTGRYSSQALVNAISLNLKNAISASLSVTGSSFNCSFKNIAVGIYEEISSYER
ncbi:hypothetical protein FLM48_17140 [Shewanella sp. Scap07]|uniref:hypothetical protein n=1 Tax=Shewanella sp. Scap07 TaxID=2589987 RepID=UPI0015BFC109|nr:hypothetical protein [Shewanella sp. Scap07]QLE86645.1 hypothetical protein FLM48_17140 [Shewanella sp. Scap07]